MDYYYGSKWRYADKVDNKTSLSLSVNNTFTNVTSVAPKYLTLKLIVNN